MALLCLFASGLAAPAQAQQTRPTWVDDPVLSNVLANPGTITLGESSYLQWTPREDVVNVVVTLPDGTKAEVDPMEGSHEVTPDALGTFTYTLAAYDEEGALLLPTFDLTVTVRPPNTPPVAEDDTAVGAWGDSVTIQASDLLENDRDADGDTLTVTAVSGAVGGAVRLNSAVITFTHDGKTKENVSFTYTVSDGRGGTDTATVAVTVTEPTEPPAPNTPPVAEDDTAVGAWGDSVAIQASDLLENDRDADGDTLTVTAVSGAVGGAVRLNGAVITFTHDGKTKENVSFTYTVSDGRGGTDTATVAVTVTEPTEPAGAQHAAEVCAGQLPIRVGGEPARSG